MLLPKNERGKGKILSNLDLHKGPIKPGSTPRIQVQHLSNDSNTKDQLAGHESDRKDRLAPSDAESMARSHSQDQIRKKKVSEKEAQSKRLLKNGPKKTTPAPKVKEDHPAVKKGPKKANVPKSSEFVNDSDEEDGLEDASTLRTQPMTPSEKIDPTLPIKAAASPRSVASASKTDSTKAKASKPALSSRNLESTMAGKKTDSKPSISSRNLESTTAGKKTDSKPVTPSRPDATSKPKLAAASHIDGKNAKSKDVKSEKTRMRGELAPSTPPVKAHQKKAVPSASSSPAPRHRISDSSQGSTGMKKTISRQRTTSSPHKPSPLGSSPPTNASDFENGVSSASSTSFVSQTQKTSFKPNGVGPPVNGHARNTSEHSLKRKADDLDSDIHAHSNPVVNGNVNGTKRHKASAASPSTSESSNSSLANSHALKRAQDFKTYYAKYEILYREVFESKDAPQDKIDNVKRMHQRLIELKEEITLRLV